MGCREQASKPAARFARLHNRIHGFEPAIAFSNMIPSACAADKVLLQGRQHLPVAGLACLQSQCAHQVDGRALLAYWRTAYHAPQTTGSLNPEARDRLALRRKGVHVRHLLKALQTKSAESVSNRVCTSGQLQGAREDTELSFMVQEPKEILTRRAFPQAFKGSSGTLHQLWLLLNTCISFARMLGTSCAWCNTMVRNYVLKLPCCPVAWKCPAPGPEGFKQAGQVADGLKSTRQSNAFRILRSCRAFFETKRVPNLHLIFGWRLYFMPCVCGHHRSAIHWGLASAQCSTIALLKSHLQIAPSFAESSCSALARSQMKSLVDTDPHYCATSQVPKRMLRGTNLVTAGLRMCQISYALQQAAQVLLWRCFALCKSH